MKSKLLRSLLLFAVLAAFMGVGFEGYRWWSAHQRKKALSLYFRKNSPVTRRLPADATIYLNLLGARRLLDNAQGTRFYRVFSHWLDTGMGENKGSNPVMGGMLEKTLLNVFGEEFGIALVPSANHKWDVMAVARLAPGSDFLLKLALSQNRKMEQTEFGDQTIFTVKTKNLSYPQFYLAIDSDFAYASSSMDRIRTSLQRPGEGPAFLSDLPEETLPENTTLFLKGNEPRISALGYVEPHRFRLQIQSDLLMDGPMPAVKRAQDDVLELITNASEIFHQPAAHYSIRNVEGSAVSAIVMAFATSDEARVYAETLANENTPEMAETLRYDDYSCFYFPSHKEIALICQDGPLLLIANDRMDPRPVFNSSSSQAAQKHPLILRIRFNSQAVNDFASLADKEDWSAFPQSKILYFLSCLRNINGNVDGNNNEIVAEIQ